MGLFGGGGDVKVDKSPWGPAQPYMTGGQVDQVPTFYGGHSRPAMPTHAGGNVQYGGGGGYSLTGQGGPGMPQVSPQRPMGGGGLFQARGGRLPWQHGGPKGQRNRWRQPQVPQTDAPGVLPEAAEIYKDRIDSPVQMNPHQLQGLYGASNYANSADLRRQIDTAMGGNQWMAGGALLDPRSNPGLQGSIDYLGEQMGDQFSRNILPSIRDEFSMSDPSGWGQSRQDRSVGLAAGDIMGDFAGRASQMIGNNYQQGLGHMSNAIGRTGQVAGLGLMPSQIQGQVGDAFRGQAEYENQYPWQQLGMYSNAVNQVGGQGGSTTQPGMQSGGLGGAIGGGLAGAGMAGSIAGLSTPWGAGLGALAGLFG